MQTVKPHSVPPQYFVICHDELFQLAKSFGVDIDPHGARGGVEDLEAIVDDPRHAIHRLCDAPAGLDEFPVLAHLGMLHEFLQRRTESFNDRRDLVETLTEVRYRHIGLSVVLQKLGNVPNLQIQFLGQKIELSARLGDIRLTKQLDNVGELLDRPVIAVDLRDEGSREHPHVLIQLALLNARKPQLTIIVDRNFMLPEHDTQAVNVVTRQFAELAEDGEVPFAQFAEDVGQLIDANLPRPRPFALEQFDNAFVSGFRIGRS